MTRPRAALVTVGMTIVLVACTAPGSSPSGAGSSATPAATSSHAPMQSASPGATATPVPGGTLASAELKYLLADALGPLWYCDPDAYPVARDDEGELATQRFDEIRGDGATFTAIIDHLGLELDSSFDADDRLAIYREWKMLNAVQLEPSGSDAFRFDYLAQPASGDGTGTRSTGTIDAGGRIDVEREEDAPMPACPICLARGTLVDTPGGPVPVEDLAVDDLVWSLDRDGRRTAVPVLRVGSMVAPDGHRVIRLRLADGREVTASAPHPLADGRPIGTVRVGDDVDGARVVSVTVLPYSGDRTYDLLPAGPTGAYWADRIALESTLRRVATPATTIAAR